MRLMMRRHGSVGEEEEEEKDLPQSDIYFIFDGGKTGNHNEYMKPFAGRTKFRKTWLIHREEESVQQRTGKSQGLATCPLQEHLHVISASRPEVRRHYFTHFAGSSTGTLIGPVRMPPYNMTWQMQWKDKKALYGPKNLIMVGGRATDEADEDAIEEPPERRKPRTPETEEPVSSTVTPVASTKTSAKPSSCMQSWT